MNKIYLDTARLLTQVAPLIFANDVFALKGGTAINLFVRDMPRLSVDLDLVFVDSRAERDEALARIQQEIRNAADQLNKRGFKTRATAAADATETKLFVERDRIQIKVEVNYVMRGTVHPVRRASLSTNCLRCDGNCAISVNWPKRIRRNSRLRPKRWKYCSIGMQSNSREAQLTVFVRP